MSEQTSGQSKRKCPKCGEQMYVAYVEPDGSSTFFSPNNKGLITTNKSSAAMAMVCGTCGFAELYATEPQKLRQPPQR